MGPPSVVIVRVVGEQIIRSATEHDIDSLLELWHAAGGTASVTDTHAGLLFLLAADPEALLLAEVEGVVVGSLIATWDGWRGSFYRLAVHPDYRRAGLATALLREGERRLQARGAVRLTAIVTNDDPVATGFWSAAGYERQGSQARYVRHMGG
jgi:ribosomal protein S18 acetylase RimI-like enzyme